MHHFAPLALAACLGAAAVSASLPAAAGVVVSVGVPVPHVVVGVPPLVRPWPYVVAPTVAYPGYVYPGYVYPGFVRYGYGVPYAGYHIGYRPGGMVQGYYHRRLGR